MNKFSTKICLLFIAVAALFSSCEKDEVRPTLTISRQAIFFSALDESATISYSGTNIDKISFNSSTVPDGWDVSINKSKKKITVYGPTESEDFDSSLDASTISFTATSVDDLTSYDYLTVGTTKNEIVDISADQANCFVVSEPNTIYQFSALAMGENQGTIDPVDVKILWQTSPASLSYSRLVGDNVEFYVNIDEDDKDEDDEKDDLIEGNAVIAAYNSKGDIIWSWHIWVSDDAAADGAVTLNGATVMARNLGAKANSIEDEDAIHDSYGMYYQWGRKDPFVGASSYNAAYGYDASMLSETGTSASISYKNSTKSIGTEGYATKYPLTYILGVEGSSYDWIYSAHSSELWSDTKTINDPCPKGWRVASLETLENLSIPALSEAENEVISNDYGWLLTDNAASSNLFMALGRRGYITGKIQIINDNLYAPAPWSGYYWTNAADGAANSSASALYFAYDKESVANNTIAIKGHYRSNGMQVRCQRD